MFGFLGLIVGFIEDGISAAIEATVVFLQWAVGALWAYAISVYNGLITLGSHVLEGFQKAWDFLKGAYEDVLKPAWEKFNELFQRVRAWLNDTFGPVLRFLRAVRQYILDFYKTWIRPVLDAIDATRGILRILEDLHIAWAKTLDDLLGKVETGINQAFSDVLGPLNRIIDVVNSIVTGDLLLQRVPFLLTLRRDIHYANAALLQARLDLRTTPEPGLRTATKLPREPFDQYARDLAAFYRDGSGPYAEDIPSLVTNWQQAAGLTSAPTGTES